MGRGAGPGGDPTITHERSTWHRVESANRVGRVTRRRGSRKGTVTGCRVRETWWQRASNYDGSCDEIRAMSGMPLTTELEALFRDHNSHGSTAGRAVCRRVAGSHGAIANTLRRLLKVAGTRNPSARIDRGEPAVTRVHRRPYVIEESKTALGQVFNFPP